MNIHEITFPIPRIIFIENSIQIEWKFNNSDITIKLSDYINDVSIYSSEKNGPPTYGNIKKERIIDRVIFWLTQYLQS